MEKIFDLIKSVITTFTPKTLSREELKEALGYNDKTKAKSISTEQLQAEYDIMKAKAFARKLDIIVAPLLTVRSLFYCVLLTVIGLLYMSLVNIDSNIIVAYLFGFSVFYLVLSFMGCRKGDRMKQLRTGKVDRDIY